MKDIDSLFFELIRVAIGTQGTLSRLPSVDEWGELYKMAKKQSLVGICFAGLQRLGADADEGFERIGMSEKLYLTWMGMAVKIQQRNEKVDRQCVELQMRLAKDGFRSCILKGQGVARLYNINLDLNPNLNLNIDLSGLRQSGDIDVYVECGRDRMLEYLHSIGMKRVEWDYVHAHAHFFDDTEVEVHYRVGAVRNLWKNRRLQCFWKNNETEFFERHVILPCGEIVCPSVRMHLFYLLHHTYRHLISGGIGLRQMMDLYFALLSRDEANDEWLKVQTQIFGMKDFAEAMVWVMREVFGMSMIGLPWIPNDREGRFLLDEIMIGGNFGKNDKRFGECKSKRSMLLQIVKRNWHLNSHFGGDALAAPFYYVWHFCWKRLQ